MEVATLVVSIVSFVGMFLFGVWMYFNRSQVKSTTDMIEALEKRVNDKDAAAKDRMTGITTWVQKIEAQCERCLREKPLERDWFVRTLNGELEKSGENIINRFRVALSDSMAEVNKKLNEIDDINRRITTIEKRLEHVGVNHV